MLAGKLFPLLLIGLSLLRFGQPKLVPEEVDALGEIVRTLGSKYWKFDADTCKVEAVGMTQVPPRNAEHNIECTCNNGSNTDCHVVRIALKNHNLPGILPPQLVKLPYLQEVDFAYNYLNGSVPLEWSSMPLTSISLLVNRLSGKIPKELGNITTLTYLDVSFNKLTGKIPPRIASERLRFVFLTDNLLSGDVPDSIFKQGSNIDLSYNNFESQGPAQPACQDNLGGKDLTIKENETDILYEGDAQMLGGTARYFLNEQSYWGISSTGDFLDDNDYQNTRYTVATQSPSIPELYSTARIAPISLTYFHYCLENDKYTVRLHFAEIVFTNDRTYTSLGKRVFDVYIQGNVVLKDFNVEDKAGGAQRPLVIPISNVNVTDNVLEIRFYYAGKGTTRIPDRGVYGPIISAISVVSDSKACSKLDGGGGKKGTVYAIVGVVGAFILGIVILGALWWKGCLPGKCAKRRGSDEDDLPKGTFTLKQIRAATNNFDHVNKIGEGGFGPVYKGVLNDGTLIAVKQLSSKSRQGNREFLNEIGMISCLKHPNLVKLHGFCVEGDQLLVVYEYMVNNSLARVLFGECRENTELKLDWPTRFKICVGIAKGLAFLHEESVIKIVHRDIKATNVLLDQDLNPKISDFGLARLDEEEEKTHVSTRVAGTIGYMAPEYALWGHLSYKADVYSFGVLMLEIVSGKNNNNFMPSNNCVCLLDWACHLQQSGNLLPIIDETLRSEVKKEQAQIMIKVGLLCTNASPNLRPTMSEVVSMLEGRIPVPNTIPEPSSYAEDLRFKALRDLRKQGEAHSQTQSHGFSKNTVNTCNSSSLDTTTQEFFEIKSAPPISTRIGS
ncbi:Probable LRR receptor-like serine/threonine-protein kinase RFK1 [Linum perenne]